MLFIIIPAFIITVFTVITPILSNTPPGLESGISRRKATSASPYDWQNYVISAALF
jgi:hypothetical protein